jgi:hypothetical protein
MISWQRNRKDRNCAQDLLQQHADNLSTGQLAFA